MFRRERCPYTPNLPESRRRHRKTSLASGEFLAPAGHGLGTPWPDSQFQRASGHGQAGIPNAPQLRHVAPTLWFLVASISMLRIREPRQARKLACALRQASCVSQAWGVMKHFATIDSQRIPTSPDAPHRRRCRVGWWRALAVWAVLVCAESVHGTIRALVMAPALGDFRSRQVGVFTGSLLILSIAYFSIRWIGAHSTTSLLKVGLVWLVLMVLFEIGFGRLVVGASWQRLWSDYNILQGGLLPIGLAVLALSPLIVARVWRPHKEPPP
jgi:hypothetical protein